MKRPRNKRGMRKLCKKNTRNDKPIRRYQMDDPFTTPPQKKKKQKTNK